MNQTLDLFRLQKIDSQRDQASNRIREIDTILQSDQRLRQAKLALHQATSELELSRQGLLGAEESVRTLELKIGQNEAALFGGRIHNPKELQDLQNEASALKRRHSSLEDLQIEAMLGVESAEAKLAHVQAEFEKVKAESDQHHAALINEKNVWAKNLERLESERNATQKSISVDHMKIYDQLRQLKRGVAIAEVIDSSCAVCGATLTPAEYQQARSVGSLYYCPSCGRILYAG
jgi:predicted  nucleic acid-binding Zn-ribbon protein